MKRGIEAFAHRCLTAYLALQLIDKHSKLFEGATYEQLNNFRIVGECEGIHWPELDIELAILGWG